MDRTFQVKASNHRILKSLWNEHLSPSLSHSFTSHTDPHLFFRRPSTWPGTWSTIMLALIFYIFLALIVAAIVISVLLCALFLLWILVKIGLGLHVKVLEYGTLYTTAYPTISMVILAPYLANKALDFRNELDRKLCDLQDPDDELMLRDMSRELYVARFCILSTPLARHDIRLWQSPFHF